jgi:hypothetical protein
VPVPMQGWQCKCSFPHHPCPRAPAKEWSTELVCVEGISWVVCTTATAGQVAGDRVSEGGREEEEGGRWEGGRGKDMPRSCASRPSSWPRFCPSLGLEARVYQRHRLLGSDSLRTKQPSQPALNSSPHTLERWWNRNCKRGGREE